MNAALEDAYRQAEELLLARLGTVTLAALSNDFHRRMASGRHNLEEISHGV